MSARVMLTAMNKGAVKSAVKSLLSYFRCMKNITTSANLIDIRTISIEINAGGLLLSAGM